MMAKKKSKAKRVRRRPLAPPKRVRRRPLAPGDEGFTLPIVYEDHDAGRFNCVGRCSGDRLFMAFVTGAYPSDPVTGRQRFPNPGDGIGPKDHRFYGVVHLFDPDGKHLETIARCGGHGRRKGGDKAFELAGEILETLGELQFCDIRVQLFRVTIEDRVFGLIHERDDEGYEAITLWPNDIVFSPPWDGEYST